MNVGKNNSLSHIQHEHNFATPYTNASKLFINITLMYNNNNSSDVLSATIIEITQTKIKFNIKKISTTETSWTNDVYAHVHITQLV
jgi:hypothetical protein